MDERSGRVFLAAAMMALSVQSAGCQVRLDELQRGARIRVVAPAAGVMWPARALVDSVSADSVYLHDLSDPPALRSAARVAVARASISRVEVPKVGAQTRMDHAGKGALVGLGLYLVWATTYVVHERRTCDPADCFGEGMAWIGLAWGVPVVACTGAAVGFLLPVRQWRRISLGS